MPGTDLRPQPPPSPPPRRQAHTCYFDSADVAHFLVQHVVRSVCPPPAPAADAPPPEGGGGALIVVGGAASAAVSAGGAKKPSKRDGSPDLYDLSAPSCQNPL